MTVRRLLLLAALLCALPASASAAGPGTTSLIDRPDGLGALPFDGANESWSDGPGQVSADGRYVVFESEADQLLPPGSDPSKRHVFLRDRVAQTTTLVDTNGAGDPGNSEAYRPVISANGDRVAFISPATNLVGTAVGGANVYVKDLSDASTRLVSRATGAAGAAANSALSVAINDDGTRIAFTTEARLDAPMDPSSSTPDVYLRNLAADTTTLISRANGAGTPASGAEWSGQPAISGDGNTVAFETSTPLAGAGDANGTIDVYLRTGATTSLASGVSGSTTTAGNARSTDPSLNSDGFFVAFTSSATTIVGGDSNGSEDVFVRDTGTNTTLLVSRPDGSAVNPANGHSYGPSISSTGAKVAFASQAANLPSGSGETRVYVRTISSNATVLASRLTGPAGAPAGGSDPSLSGDGNTVAFESSDPDLGGVGEDLYDVYARSTTGNTTAIASIPSGTTTRHADVRSAAIGEQAVSDDGRYVVFTTLADGLGDPGRARHVYLRDTVANTTRRVDAVTGTGGDVAISGDGSTVAYAAAPSSTRGAPSDTNVYAFRVAEGTTTVVAQLPDGTLPDGAAFGPSLNRDGTRIAFESWATNLDPSDTSTDTDVYLRDLAANTMTLVSRGDGAGTPSASSSAGAPSIDAEGRRVAFHSAAPGLASGDANGKNDVFVRDVGANTTTLASRKDGDGAAGDDDSSWPSLSGDGTKVAFETRATDVGDGGGAPVAVYLRDLAAGTTRLMSRVGVSGPAAEAYAADARLSRDGTTVAYATPAQNLLGFFTQQERIVVRTIADGTTVIGSRGDGASGPLPERSSQASINANGNCLVFTASGTGLVAGGYPSPDFEHVYHRVLGGECPVPPAPAPPISAPVPAPLPKPVGPTPDRTAPTITGATLAPKTFAAAAANARAAGGTKKKRKKVARGTTVRFRLSENAAVVLTAQRRERGRRSGRKCVKSTPRLVKRKAKRCTRYVEKGKVRVTGKSGANRVAFSGRINRKAIPRGAYRLLVDATDAARNKARTRTLTFTIVKG